MPALMLPRVGTVYSLTQLAGEPGEAGCVLPPGAKGVLSTPEKAVSELGGGASLLPLYAFPPADGFAAKRVRSFGSFADLAGAGAVPDVDARGPAAGGAGASSASDEESSEDGSSDSGQVTWAATRAGWGLRAAYGAAADSSWRCRRPASGVPGRASHQLPPPLPPCFLPPLLPHLTPCPPAARPLP